MYVMEKAHDVVDIGGGDGKMVSIVSMMVVRGGTENTIYGG